MTAARLSVSVPEDSWKAAVLDRHSEASLRIDAATTTEARTIELVTVSQTALSTVRSALETIPSVRSVSVLDRTGDARLEVEGRQCPIHVAAREAGVPIETPYEVADGDATIDVTSSHDRLSKLGDELRARGLSFRVEYVQESHDARELLTETQESLVRAAVQHGYYDAPRECTLTELAERVGLAKSTCSETLQRAQAAIVAYYISETPTLTDTRSDPAPADSTATGQALSGH